MVFLSKATWSPGWAAAVVSFGNQIICTKLTRIVIGLF